MLIQLCDMGTLHNLSKPRFPHVEKDNNTPSMVKVKWVTAGSWSKIGSYMFTKKKHLMKYTWRSEAIDLFGFFDS